MEIKIELKIGEDIPVVQKKSKWFLRYDIVNGFMGVDTI